MKNIFITLIFIFMLFNSEMVLADNSHEKHHNEYNHKIGEHEAPHGGCLNIMKSCEFGHAEVKVTGETIEIWFVGGGTETSKAVRIKDNDIKLEIAISGMKEKKELILKADPIVLAEEAVGDCSHFVGSDPSLKIDSLKFKATAKVNFKGILMDTKIAYPEGIDD